MYLQALLFVILATAQAQLVSKGPCEFSIPELKSGFSVGGTAYEIRRISNNWNTGHCASWELRITDNSLFVTLKEVDDHKLIERTATGNVNSDKSFSLTFTDFSSNFTFIGMDDEFVVLYACSNQGENKQEYAWLLASNTTISESARNQSLNIINTMKLSNASWMEISHTKESCNGGANHLIFSPIIVLIVGFVLSKGL